MIIESRLLLHFELINDNIVFAELSSLTDIDEAAANRIVEQRLAFMKGKKHFMVADVSKVRKISPAAKEIMQNPEGGMKDILGAAIIASNPVSALLANIFIKAPKNFEARFFWNKRDALAWINEYKRNHAEKTKISA